jgi:hypothetical protein
MGAPDNPFASLAPQQQPAASDNGNPFSAIATSARQQQAAQPGFLERAYSTSPLPGIFHAAQQSIADFVKGPDQANQAFQEMVGSLSAPYKGCSFEYIYSHPFAPWVPEYYVVAFADDSVIHTSVLSSP